VTPCVSFACSLPVPLADAAAGYADAGAAAVEAWLPGLEQHLAADPADPFAARGLTPVAAAYQGGLLLSAGAARQAAFAQFRRRLDVCQRLGIPTLLVAADPTPKPDAAALATAVASLTEAARWAAGFGVTLGLEFRADAVVACLETALLVVAECGEANVGVCLDAFHFYKGSSKADDLDRLTPGSVAHVQLCDVPGLPREVMTDADRVFPGEGDFRLDVLTTAARRAGYAGPVSVEVPNPMVWAAKPSQAAELALAAVRRFV
jgi:2-keto-myo-inositol isomerase